MKLFLILFIFSLAGYSSFGQSTSSRYKCNCQKIGLDSIWADTNRVSCYLIPVERNFQEPRKKYYLLAVATAPAIAKTPKEPLLYLHGGPGIATLSNFPKYLKSKTFSLLRENHELVFFDYRGTGYSEPVLCSDLSDTMRSISNANLELNDEILKTTIAYSNCRASLIKQDILLSDFSSLQSASDAETIRKALIIKNWNIYSVSHGTTVALNMMRTFPKHIKSVILDSPFPPNAPWSDFIHPFDLSFKTFEKNISSDTQYAKLFPSIRTDLIKITERLRKTPFQIKSQSADSTSNRSYSFDDGDFIWSMWAAMVDRQSISLVPLALKEIAAGNDSVLLHWATIYNDPNSFGEFALAQSKAILYYESKPKTKEETEKYLLSKFPDYKSFITPGLEEALYKTYRPELPSPTYFKAVSSTIPTLVFSGEYDPVCPPVFGQLTSKSLINSTLIIVPSSSHAAMYTDDCTRRIAKEFYLNPYKKPKIGCVSERKKIEFVTTDILSLLK